MLFPVIRARHWLALALLALVLAGCGRSAPVPGSQASLHLAGEPGSSPTATPLPATPRPTIPSPTPSATPTATPVVEIPDADAYLTREVAANRFSGVVLVVQNGHILLEKGYGLADREKGIPNTPQTRFHIGSLTKQFTAMLIMQLQERGKLQVGDLVSSHLPNCPSTWSAITIDELLTHTSGLMDFFDLPGLDGLLTQRVTPDKIVNLFRDQPLLFRPGSEYSYSNSGFVLLGQIIEQASGESYASQIQKNILTPVGMTATTYGSSGPAGACAVGYETAWQRAPDVDLSLGYAAGGLCSTVEDLYRWDQALNTTTLCSQASLDAMFSPHFTLAPNVWEGYGWVIRDLSGHRRISHTGLLYGFSSINARYPDDGVTIIILSNLEDAPLTDYVDFLAKQVLK